MKWFCLSTVLLLSILVISRVQAQRPGTNVDSLQHLLQTARQDSTKARLYHFIANQYRFHLEKLDSALFYYQKSYDLNRKLGSPLQIIPGNQIASLYNMMGNYPAALQVAQQNLKLEEQLHDTASIFFTKREIMWVYRNIGEYQKALALAKELDSFSTSGYFKDPKTVAWYQQMVRNNLANLYLDLNQLDSSAHYRLMMYRHEMKTGDLEGLALATSGLADLYAKMNRLDSCVYYNRLCLAYAAASHRPDIFRATQVDLARAFLKTAQLDSAFQYAHQALHAYKNIPDTSAIMDAALVLSDLYKSRKRFDSAYTFLSYYTSLKDSSLKEEKIKKVQNILFNEALLQQQLEQERKAAQQQYAARVKMYSLLAGLGVVVLLAAVLYRNNRQKQRAKQEIEKAYHDLKATQAQLIHSEKMASLGELTAGIAHEIQNPLNFVNNFSDLNKELLEDLKAEIENGNFSEVALLATNIEANEVKIALHGRRADGIVKSMLQHSSISTGQNEPTYINTLVDEYLRLSYHGLRAKDKGFNAKIETYFDESIGKLNIVPQEIGRVLLNLFNNAFYAINEKVKKAGQDFEPLVTVSTKRVNGKVEIAVQDNGMGISKSVQDKIFQPFFTTKPTGEGTGLGLSLSYDIVKAHGGDLKVESTEGEGAVFIIQLPLERKD
jgi:signal transduction histidine kinase